LYSISKASTKVLLFNGTNKFNGGYLLFILFLASGVYKSNPLATCGTGELG
jgi:hypothetical protein